MKKDKPAKWQAKFKQGRELVLVTCSEKADPNANIVVSLGLVDGQLLVADCQMKKTISNLKKNHKIVVIGGYYRLCGKATISTKGKYFDLCVAKSKGYTVKNAIRISIQTVFDLDQGQLIRI